MSRKIPQVHQVKTRLPRPAETLYCVRHQNNPGHPPVRVISLRMNETKMRSVEPSSAPGQPDPKGVAPDQPTAQSTSAPHSQNQSVPAILLEGDEPVEGPGEWSTKAKAAVPGHEEPPRTESSSSALPSNYGTGKLLLVARDPGSLYAHWDLPADRQTGDAAQALEQRLRIRVHRKDLGGPLLTDLPVSRESNHCFIPVDPGGARYVAELGFHPAQGGWTAIATSDPVVGLAEPAGPRPPVEFGTLRFGLPADSGSGGAGEAQVQGGQTMPRPPLSPPLPRQFPLPPPLTPVSASLIQTGSAAGESPDHDKLATVADQPIGAGKAGFAAGSPIWAAQASEWTAAQEAALAELIGPAVLRRDGPTSADIPELIRGELNVSSGAAPASLPFAEGIAAVSSAGLNQAPPKPGAFWLNVNAELVLYGATEADAQVTVAGQPVQLRPDGTFSCRFALPDGFYQLAVQANSARGELRQAELDFSRATRFGAETGDLALDAALKPPVAPPPNPPYF